MPSRSIAFFITPHGFGHATRSAAIMAALQACMPKVRLELFTTCPSHIFADSLQQDFGYHALVTDIGMVQTSSLDEDPDATCRQLDRWLPFDQTLVGQASDQLKALNCAAVVSDISPLGIAAAHHAGLPAVLVENFTWDWIYQSYLPSAPGLQIHIDYLEAIFGQADHHIQATPCCRSMPGTIQVAPISRKPRLGRRQIRRRLNIPDHAKMVLVSMGGVADSFEFLSHLPANLDFYLVIPGANDSKSPHKGVILLPTHSDFFHPDLIQAADALIGKAGYSTVAEAYHAGIPFGYICRPIFPESARLERFICEHLPAHAIDPESYRDGRWIDTLHRLFDSAPRPQIKENGAHVVAKYIHDEFF